MRHFLATTTVLVMITLSVSVNAKEKKNTHPTPHKNPCRSLKSCADHVSRLLGHKYIFAEKLEGAVKFSQNIKLNKNNIEKYFSEALNLNGLTRVKLDDDLYRIISSRDVRFSPVSVIEVKDYNIGVIPNLSDYFLVSVQLKNPEYPSEITRSLRPFLSRYGRIISENANGVLIIQDTGRNLRRITKLVQKLDRPLNGDAKERIEKLMNMRHEQKIHENTHCKK